MAGKCERCLTVFELLAMVGFTKENQSFVRLGGVLGKGSAVLTFGCWFAEKDF